MFAYEIVTSILPKRSFQRDSSAKFDSYKWSILFNSFDVRTFNRDISDVDVVLTSLEYYNKDNRVVQSDFYKDLDKYQFSTMGIVIVEGKSYLIGDEAQLLDKFESFRLIIYGHSLSLIGLIYVSVILIDMVLHIFLFL